ncbi:MAG: hypothetical protein GY800_10600, partial [Planctomycetes bacterium]|nr:hypothetical protein [Planctomycetota bacterium]
ETDCGKQDNGYDCGIFTISYIAKAIENLGNKNNWKNMTTTQEEADVLRKLMLNQIELEIIRYNNFIGTKRKNIEGSGNGRSNEKEDTNNNGNNNGNNMDGEKYKTNGNGNARTIDNKNEQVNYRKGNKGDDDNKQVGNNKNNESRETKECWNFNAGTCKYGDECIYIHKEICIAWKKHGDCERSTCQFNHPKLCFFEGSCKRTNCSYLQKTETSNMKGKNQQRYRNADVNHAHGNNFGHPNRIQQNIKKKPKKKSSAREAILGERPETEFWASPEQKRLVPTDGCRNGWNTAHGYAHGNKGERHAAGLAKFDESREWDVGMNKSNAKNKNRKMD